MTTPLDLLALLPPSYRASDRGSDGMLPLLMEALAAPYATLSTAADALYDEWFIGTCSPRAIALIGELVGVGTDPGVAARLPSWRRYVADAAAYRRSKGRLDTLACATAAASGWGALARLDADVISAVDIAASDGRDAVALPPAFDRSRRLLAASSTEPEAEAITLFLWRLQVYPTRRLAASPLGGGRYIADPLGIERPMYRVARTDTSSVHPIIEADLPLPLTLAALAAALADPPAAGPLGIGLEGPVAVRLNGVALATETLIAADLAEWRVDWPDGARAAIDPERGRVLLHPRAGIGIVTVDRCHAAPADIGGGPYPRGEAGGTANLSVAGGGNQLVHTLAAGGIVEIDDSLRYDGGLTIDAQASVVLRARIGETPSIDGDVIVRGGAAATVALDGLWIAGAVRIEGDVKVALSDCTVRGDGVERRHADGGGRLSATRCILSRVADPSGGAVTIAESLIDGTVEVSGALDADRSTFLGRVETGSVTARDSLFDAPLTAADPSSGAIAHCYVAPGSATPPREDGADGERPLFVSRRYGKPGFGQLDPRAPSAIATGASNGWEIGCFNAVAAPLRQAALDQAIADIAPWRWQVHRVIVQ